MRSIVVGVVALFVPSVAWSSAIEVAVDRRVEIVAEVCALAGLAGYDAGPDTPATLAAREWFAPFAGHPAVLEAQRLQQQRGIAYDQPMSLAAHLDPRTLRPTWRGERLPERLSSRWDDATARGFAVLLADFAEDSRFDAFLESQAGYVAEVEGYYREFLAQRDLVGWFDGVFGPSEGARYTVVPGLLHGTGNFGVSAAGRKGTHFTPVIGSGRVDERGVPVLSRAIELLIVHELAHGRVNPVIDADPEAIEAGAKAVFGSAPERMEAIGYAEWRAVAYESLVRGITVAYAADRLDARAEALAAEEAVGFWWTREVVDALDACRATDGSCPGLALAEVSAALVAFAEAPRTPPFRGPINATFDGPWVPDRFAMVVPGGSADLAAYVGKVHGALFAEKGVPVVDPGAVPEGRPATMVYGSPSTNPWTASVLAGLGWHVGEDGVRVGDAVFDGPDLVLVAAVAHPDHPELPVLLYTAADDADLVGVHGFFAGPTDWVVARRGADGAYTIVGEGDLPLE